MSYDLSYRSLSYYCSGNVCEMDEENQNVIYIDNWNDVCRLCLRNDQPLENMFVEQNFLENIQEVTNLVVSKWHFIMYICRFE